MDDASLSLWLRLRERADWRSRSASLTQSIVRTLPNDRPVRILDLGTGAGSNLRYLLERIPLRQHWLLVDRSAALLADAESRTRTWAETRGLTASAAANGFVLRGDAVDCHVEMRAQDLGPLDDPAMFSGRDLVTASALLDLVSENWLRTIASRSRVTGASALFTINYDGRSTCDPPEPEDELIRGLMNAHQRRDKGLGGPAEGPRAVETTERCFADEGYRVRTVSSDWVLDPGDGALQRQLIEGWAFAATEMAQDSAAAIASWRSRRLAHVDAGQSRLSVGHQDIGAWLE